MLDTPKVESGPEMQLTAPILIWARAGWAKKSER
jgi:hypothetical protein